MHDLLPDVGDVIKCTYVQYNGDRMDGHFPAEFLPCWAVVEEVDSNAANVYLLTKHPLDVQVAHYNPPRIAVSRDTDVFEVVSEDAWPDEVCAALGKYSLIGED